MALFSLIAKLGLDKTGFEAGLTGARRSVAHFGSTLTRSLAAAFSTAAVAAYTRSLIEYASHVKEAALKTGAGSDAIQTMGHAAKLAGADLEDVVRGFKFLSKARLEALKEPGKEYSQIFSAMGIDAKALKELRLEDLFRRVAAAFQQIDFGAGELGMVVKLLGRGGEVLLPLFKRGLTDLEDQARKSGAVLGDDLIDPLHQLGQEWIKLRALFREPFAEVLVKTLHAVNAGLNWLISTAKKAVLYFGGFAKGLLRPLDPTLLKGIRRDFPGVLGLPVRVAAHFAEGAQEAESMVKFGEKMEEREAAEKKLKQLGTSATELWQKFRMTPGQILAMPGLNRGVMDMFLGKPVAGERAKRDFFFEEEEKRKAEKAPRIHEADLLGRIGGTVGGGESTTNQRFRDMVTELKELRRTVEFRGVQLKGEL